MVAGLGPDGTSLDETDDEEVHLTHPKFLRIPKVWRSPAIDPVLRYIDQHRDDLILPFQTAGRAGEPPRVRVGDHPTICNNTVACGLPENLYDHQWLDSRHPQAVRLLGVLPFVEIPDVAKL